MYASIDGASNGASPVSNAPQWVVELLDAIAAPITAANVAFLEAWQAHEGSGVLSAGNPLAITGTPGQGGSSGAFNSFSCKAPGGQCHVLSFPSLSAGVSATASFLKSGYASMVDALQSGDPQGYAQNNPSVISDSSSGWSYISSLFNPGGGASSSSSSSGAPSSSIGQQLWSVLRWGSFATAPLAGEGGASFFGEPFLAIGGVIVGLALIVVGVIWLAGYEVTSSGVARAAVKAAPGGASIGAALEALA